MQVQILPQPHSCTPNPVELDGIITEATEMVGEKHKMFVPGSNPGGCTNHHHESNHRTIRSGTQTTRPLGGGEFSLLD